MRNPYLKEREKHDARAILPKRLYILLGISFLLTLALVLQLGYLTLVKGGAFTAEVNKADETVEKGSVPRGLIYDSTGKVIAGNKSQEAITFTRSTGLSTHDIYLTANKLSKYLTIDTDKLSKRTVLDYWLQNPENKAKADQYVNKEIKGKKGVDNADVQQLLLKYAKNQHIELSDKEKNAAMIFQKMVGAYQLSTTYIKEKDVSEKELAEIGERLSDLPGVKIGTSWSRDYPEGDEFKALVGSVTTESQGLPENQLHTLLAQGYSHNESVGNSSLEKEYESVLRGSASQTVVKGYDGQNKTIKFAGQAGDNLNLTINAKFQKDVQDLIEKNMPGGHTTGMYATVINPYNGQIYAMAGASRNNKNGKVTPNPLGNINTSIVMGSAVKPATLAMAMQHKIITPTNNVITDEKIQLVGTPPIFSYWNKSGAPQAINAETALEVSSNTYMVKLAMILGGQKYSNGMALNLNNNIFEILRNGFAQFGLGYKTGIDIPGESSGFKGPTGRKNMGKALYESFGQYDGYTVLQMARYVSAIANGGYLIKPEIVKSISSTSKNGERQNVVWSAQPDVQGRIDLTKAQWNVITKGMYLVANGSHRNNTGGPALHKLTPKVNAKTGTAETFTDGAQTFTQSLILYVPNKPVAIALAIPGMDEYLNGLNTKMGAEIMDLFWKDVMSPNEK